MRPNIEEIRRARTLIGVIALAGAAAIVSPRAATAQNSSSSAGKPVPTLYARLGGEAGIAAFTDDFLSRTMIDPALTPFFKGLTEADDARIHQHLRELLCFATGGGCAYSGKDMKTTHAQMEISNDVWNQFTGHFNETVTRFRIADRERNELVNIVASLKKDIVNR
jgi:hemoglobin